MHHTMTQLGTRSRGSPSKAGLLQQLSRSGMGMFLVASTLLLSANARAVPMPDFTSLVDQQGPAVVKISVRGSTQVNDPVPDLNGLPDSFRKYFDQSPQSPPNPQGQSRGFGSGFVISEDGYIVTNAHVVDRASEIQVSFMRGQEMTAELVGLDKTTDIALLKVKADKLPIVELGDSSSVKVGQWVLAIGSPFGFEYTATQGIVSAIARNLSSDSYVPFIQTDVAVNPGNSGGPLFSTEGKVIGVNSQIYSNSGGYQGLSFAIPSNVVKNVVEQIRTKGYASRGWLGVTIQSVDQQMAESFGLEAAQGALIASVTKNSPAEKAGLKAGDIIVNFNRKVVNRSLALPPMVGQVATGTQVPVTVLRGGTEQILTVTIAELGDDVQASGQHGGKEYPSLGLVVSRLTDEMKKELNLDTGVLVNRVDVDSPAADAGLQQADIILSIGSKPISSVEELRSIVEQSPAGKPVPVLIRRGEISTFVALTLPSTQE